MTRQPVVMVLAVLLSDWTLVDAQSLADVARKEEARRARVSKPAPVYTNKDLSRDPATKSSRVSAAPAKEPSGQPAIEAAAAGRDGEAAGPEVQKAREKRDERYWRERAALIRERLDRSRADTGALQTRMNTLKAEAAAAPPVEAVAIKNELGVATADLLRFQTELQFIEQEWTTFEQRAREANVPSRWLER